MSSIYKWDTLPSDLFFSITRILDAPSLFSMIQVCKSWQRSLTSSKSNPIWKPLTEQYSIYEYPGMDYYQAFKSCYSNHIIYKNYKSATYAASLWMDSANTMEYVKPLNSPKPIRTSQKFIISNGRLSLPPYDFRLKKLINHTLSTFQVYQNFIEGDNTLPSKVKDRYWVQAPIPRHLFNRFTQLSLFSGKFILSTKLQKIDQQWTKLNEAYQEGRLGYALKAGTAKNNHIAPGKKRVITIHLQNCFDLKEVARVAWEINNILGKWKGSLHCKLDVADFFEETDCKSPLIKPTFFILSSFIFRKRNGENKSLHKFTSLFIQHTQKTCETAKNTLIKYFKIKKPQNIDHEVPLVLFSNILDQFQ